MELNEIYLQFFAGEGGGDGGAATGGEGGNSSGENGYESVPASIPEKAKKHYVKAMAKMQASTATQTTTANDNLETTTPENPEESAETTAENTHIPFSELIKSDEYKAEHQAYMEKTISDRLKKYKGIEDQLAKAMDVLSLVGSSKYGLNADSDTFLDDIRQKAADDDDFYEDYALEHDMSKAEAKRTFQLERRLKAAEAEQARMQQEEANRQRIYQLQQAAAQTKQLYPSFDLETELQNEKFRNILAATRGDTTAAFRAVHYQEIQAATIQASQQLAQQAALQAQMQAANKIAANRSRPVENGLSSSPAIQQDEISRIKRMNLEEIQAYAQEMKRAKTRR